MNWAKRHYTDFELLRVDGHTMLETDRIDGIAVEGSITMNLNTRIKQSGSMKALRSIDFGDDLIRIYANVEDYDGSSERVALATLLAVTPKRDISGSSVQGDIDLLSVLQRAADDATESVLTIPAGTDTVPYAANLLRSAGLTVQAESSTSKLTNAWTYDAGESKLKIANELLDYANFSSADVDGMGNVILRRYTSPSGQSPVHTFRDDEASLIVAGSITDEYDWYHTPNKVICTVSDNERTLTAVATNDDPSSPFSTVSRGRVIARTEEYNDIETQSQLQAKADALLESSTRQARSVEFKHGYVPLSLGDTIRFHHEASGLDMTGAIQEMDITLSAALEVQTRIRRFE